MVRRTLVLSLFVASAACGDASAPATQGGGGGAGQNTSTSGQTTATSSTAGTTTSTSGGGGMGPHAGYGALSGACGVINLDDIDAAAPELIDNSLDLTGLAPLDKANLS